MKNMDKYFEKCTVCNKMCADFNLESMSIKRGAEFTELFYHVKCEYCGVPYEIAISFQNDITGIRFMKEVV